MIKLNNEFGKEFITNIGSPQGDSAKVVHFQNFRHKSIIVEKP